MITLKDKQQIIIAAFLEGKSFRSIARETNIDRKTVSKYVRRYEESRQKLLSENRQEGVDPREIIDDIVSKPTYQVTNREKRKLTAEIVNRIEYYINENEQKRAKGQAKQQKKKIDIYEALRAEGVEISYSTVCNTIRSIMKEGAEAYIKAEYAYGDVCEFDWGEVKIYIEGELRKVQMATFTSAKGNYRYARLFPKQNTDAFLEAHALFFEQIGGVYQTLVYDNMKIAVKKLVGVTEKEPTDSLLQLSMYYGFRFRFCNIRAGNEKGHVERSVEYIRRKAFAFKDDFNSIEAANEYLEKTCLELNQRPQKEQQNQSAMDILQKEKEYLLPKVPMYDAAKIVEPRVDKYSTIVIEQNHYSVPEQHVGKIIFTKVYTHQIICYHEGEKVAVHQRKYGLHEWSIQLDHYVQTLKKKPGALSTSVALQQADPRLQKIHQQYYIKKEKAFIELLYFLSFRKT